MGFGPWVRLIAVRQGYEGASAPSLDGGKENTDISQAKSEWDRPGAKQGAQGPRAVKQMAGDTASELSVWPVTERRETVIGPGRRGSEQAEHWRVLLGKTWEGLPPTPSYLCCLGKSLIYLSPAFLICKVETTSTLTEMGEIKQYNTHSIWHLVSIWQTHLILPTRGQKPGREAQHPHASAPLRVDMTDPRAPTQHAGCRLRVLLSTAGRQSHC